MADPSPNAERYDLSRDAAADVEDQEGPPTGAQTGQDRTWREPHSKHQGHGRKTTQATRDQFNHRSSDR
jgi:hypothetical protein